MGEQECVYVVVMGTTLTTTRRAMTPMMKPIIIMILLLLLLQIIIDIIIIVSIIIIIIIIRKEQKRKGPKIGTRHSQVDTSSHTTGTSHYVHNLHTAPHHTRTLDVYTILHLLQYICV